MLYLLTKLPLLFTAYLNLSNFWNTTKQILRVKQVPIGRSKLKRRIRLFYWKIIFSKVFKQFLKVFYIIFNIINKLKYFYWFYNSSKKRSILELISKTFKLYFKNLEDIFFTNLKDESKQNTCLQWDCIEKFLQNRFYLLNKSKILICI